MQPYAVECEVCPPDTGHLRCDYDDADECSMARERSVAGISDTIPDCAVHGTYRGEEVTA